MTNNILPLDDLGANLKAHLKSSKEGFLFRGAKIKDIPKDHLVILCQYMSAQFVSAVFGGSYQFVLQAVWKYIKEGGSATGDNDDEEELTSRYPEGIAGYLYAERLSVKVLQALEKIVLAGSSESSQVVQASKALLAETDKTQKTALDVMQAYEKQLIALSGYIVESFLPNLGKSIKEDFRQGQEELLSEIYDKLPDGEATDIVRESIEKFVRQIAMKKFELLFAKSLSENENIQQAFGFAEDLLENFVEDRASGQKVESDAVAKIREMQKKRRAKK